MSSVVKDHLPSIPDETYAQVVTEYIPTTPLYQFLHSTPLSPDGIQLIYQEQASVAQTTAHTHQVSSAGLSAHIHNDQPLDPGANVIYPLEVLYRILHQHTQSQFLQAPVSL